MSPLSQSQLGVFYACQNLDEQSVSSSVSGASSDATTPASAFSPGGEMEVADSLFRPKKGNYQVPILYTLPDWVDLPRLKTALERVVKAHPYILSHIVFQDDAVMMEEGTFSEDVVTLRSIDDLDEVRPTFRRTMNLLQDRLFRLEIYATPKGNFLYMDFHHVLFDGTGSFMLRKEIERSYDEGVVLGEALTGADLAEEELRLRQSEVWQEQREWYLKRLSDATEVDSMPVPCNMPLEDRGLLDRDFTLPLKMSTLEAICAKYGVKESMVFLAAWGKMLADYSAEDKACFATIFSGRSDPRTRQAITMMVRTLPVYMEMPPEMPVADWLHAVDEQQRGMRERGVFSFADVHQELNLRGDILFAYHGRIMGSSLFELHLGGELIPEQDLRLARPGTILDGELIVAPGASERGDYVLRMSYNSALYSDAMIAGMADAVAAIVNSMADAERVGDLLCLAPGVAPVKRNEVVVLGKETPVIELFEARVKEFPEHVCCVFENRRYSYREVGAMTDALAEQIVACQAVAEGGAGEERPVVSFIVPRNEWMMIVPLAIAKTGCTYQPLDSSYPKERLNFMIQDAEAKLLICPEEFRDLVDGYAGAVLTVDSYPSAEWVSASQQVAARDWAALRRLQADDTFVLLYTSGTTGTPKGVQLTQRNIWAFIQFHTDYLKMDCNSRVTAYASYGFDAYMQDLWAAATSGAALHIISEEIRYDLVALKDYYDREGITHGFMTTQVGTQMVMDFPEVETLQVFEVGGEKLSSIDPPTYRLINGYGPTECTVYATSEEVTKNEKNIPIGLANPSLRLYVVNRGGKEVPMGALGELWISGPQTGKGYLKLPEKTAAAFIDNPFYDGLKDFAKVYRTGDIVRYREDGKIEFIGRKDGQVKIRGFRIELKEVEAVIRDFPAVKNVTVQAFDLEAGGKAIAAYVVGDEPIDVAQLNAFIAAQKPPYMVPAVTMQLEKIPLNVNGKVDKKRLPAAVAAAPVEGAETGASNEAAAPLNCLEEELMAMIVPLANCKTFSITTPLQYVGLTSITIIKLAAQLYKRFGVTIPNKALREATLQSIENEILKRMMGGDGKTGDKASDRTEEQKNIERKASASADALSGQALRRAPLSYAQLGVYYECLKNPMATTYNIPYIARFPESVSAARLKAAVEAAIAAHPLLLAHFDNSSEVPMQVVEEGALPMVTLSDEGVETLHRTFVQPFDLAKGPLYRATVTGSTLLLDVHHLVMDGSSESLFLHDVCRALEGKPVTKEGLSFLRYAQEEQAMDVSAAEAFFAEQLTPIDEATSLPADLHGNEHSGRPAVAYRPIDHGRVEQYALAHGVTPASVYLAAFEYLAARYGNTKEVCICTVSAGRSDVRVCDTVGMFVNTLALVSQIKEERVEDYIGRVAANFAHTLEHEHYPFAKISERYALSADLAFVYQLGVVEDFLVEGRPVQMEQMELSAPKFKVSMLVEMREGKVCLVAEYNDALYSAEMMRRLLESYEQVILTMTAHPEAPVTGVSILSEAQRAEVATMNSGGTAPLPIRLLHAGMEQWARRTPDHMAVMAVDGSLTYAEFDRLANRIAHGLLKRGVKKGDAVVVLLPRRGSTIACIFGIMKAGGAYIPCDPDYPTERIALIADDSGAPYVVTTADLLANYGQRGLLIDDLVAEQDDSHPAVEVLPTDLAYYIYTSGSTGRPKGVRVAHYNITTFVTTSPIHPMRAMMEDCERLLSVATISFDASICEYAMALFNGRTYVFADEVEAKDPIALIELIKQTQPDYFGCTSSRMLQYMDLPEFCECLKHFRCILQGGEKFSEILLERLRLLNDKCVILNGYGPTEISIGCNSVDLQHAEYLSVGRPNPNYTEWIIDKDGNELPVGVIGELCVGGDGVTQGYNNLPDKTAERYITYRGMRAFKTGDYARWLPNGEVEVLGRTDNQVKLRGLRIELGEVECAIARVKGVKRVLVKICNLQGRDHLSAYFVAEQPLDVQQLKREIGQTLTAYMVPTAYLQMEAFPITPNGKVDFRHLPEPKLALSVGDYVAPANAAERFFAETFAKILDLDRVSATDSFFELGGTSLVVMKVVICAEQGGYKLTYADVFANPTPRMLAALCLPAMTGAAAQQDPDADVNDYDYTAIDGLLQTNTLEGFVHGEPLRPLGDVLLTGATGFLGIHVLKCLLEQYPDSRIHCLLRSKRGVPAEERLRQLLFYYFEKDYVGLYRDRIVAHEGDVTAPITLQEPIDTVFNCAALVKHFAQGTAIEEVNVGGVRNCIDFCLQRGARLIQVSTYSVAGAAVNGTPAVSHFTEQMLFMGQRIRNQYVHSKIMGERLLLEAAVQRGLDAKIMRVGNLSARSADGEFQINVAANSFMGRLRIYQMLGALPFSAYASPVEFSPIDETAQAICLLAQTPAQCRVFHPYNSHQQMLGDVLSQMRSIGKEVQLVEEERFVEILNQAKADPSKQEMLSAMLAYEHSPSQDVVVPIPADNAYTLQVLLRMGFRWNATSWDYVDRFLKQIDGLLFFDHA